MPLGFGPSGPTHEDVQYLPPPHGPFNSGTAPINPRSIE